MVRVSSGCLLIDTTCLEFDELISLFKKLLEKGFVNIHVLVKPASILSRRKGLSPKLYAVPPGSIAICNGLNDIADDFLRKAYLLERDAWLDTGVLNISTLLSILDIVSNSVRSSSSVVFDIGSFRFEIRFTNRASVSLVIMDSFKIPLFWLGERLDPLSESYRDLFKKTIDSSPENLHVISYYKLFDNSFESLIGFKHVDGKVLFVINAPQVSPRVMKYLFWFFIDVLLDKP